MCKPADPEALRTPTTFLASHPPALITPGPGACQPGATAIMHLLDVATLPHHTGRASLPPEHRCSARACSAASSWAL